MIKKESYRIEKEEVITLFEYFLLLISLGVIQLLNTIKDNVIYIIHNNLGSSLTNRHLGNNQGRAEEGDMYGLLLWILLLILLLLFLVLVVFVALDPLLDLIRGFFDYS